MITCSERQSNKKHLKCYLPKQNNDQSSSLICHSFPFFAEFMSYLIHLTAIPLGQFTSVNLPYSIFRKIFHEFYLKNNYFFLKELKFMTNVYMVLIYKLCKITKLIIKLLRAKIIVYVSKLINQFDATGSQEPSDYLTSFSPISLPFLFL